MRRALLLTATFAGLLVPGAAAARDGRVMGVFPMAGTITRADHVRGERTGQHVTRTWRFAPGCVAGTCRTLLLDRARAGGRSDLLSLRRTSAGHYGGGGRFFIPLRCHGRRYARGGVISFRIGVVVAATRRLQETTYVTRITATYADTRRLNRTPCPGGLGHDAARYRGSVAALPAPPRAAFAATRTGVAPTVVAFRDTSTVVTPGDRIVAWQWDFGDPASGPLNAATVQNPTHTFASTGSHVVTLTVRDANGLVAKVEQTVAG